MTNNSEELIRLAGKEFGQLTNADRKLFRAVARHEVANFKADVDELNQSELAEQWGAERTLKADRIVWLLTTPEASKILSFRGLRISGAKIEGELNLEYAKVSVPLIFNTCAFTEPLILQKSKLRELQMQGSYVSGIQAEGMFVKGSVYLSEGFKAEGEVNLLRASIGEKLDCSRGNFINERRTAINANAAMIGASVLLRNGFKSEGEVNLLRASIGGHLSCTKGQFCNKSQTAINANAAKIGASVLLRNGFKAEGRVNLCRVSIGGALNCTKGQFSNEGQTAINANAAMIGASVLLRKSFKAEGKVNLLRASIDGSIYCTGGQFLNKTGSALDAEGAKIGGSVFLGGKSNNGQFQAEGEMIFFNATIADRFELESIEGNNSESMLLDLRFAKVNTFSFKNRLAEASWSEQIKEGKLFLNGFVYDTIKVTNASIKNNTLKKWLQLQIKKDSNSQSDNGFFLQPYEQLAAVLKANGHQEAATKILVSKEEDRRRYGNLNWRGKVWNRILGVAIAYGYRPEKALIYSVIIIIVGGIVFYPNKSLMTETKINPGTSAVFNPLFYSIDTFTPVIDLHQQKMWLPDANKGEEIWIFHPSLEKRSGEWLLRYFWFQIIAGWVLTSLWVAGFTGLVRNKK